MIHLIVGLIFLCLGALGIVAWWEDFGELLRGLVPLLFILFGLAAIGAWSQRKPDETDADTE